MLRPSIKDCLSKHMICVQNTKKKDYPKSRKKNKEKKILKYRKSSLPFKKIAIKVLLSYSWASSWTSQTASPTTNDDFHWAIC